MSDEIDEGIFSKTYEGMWFLLGIPGLSIFGAIVAAIAYNLRKKFMEKREINPMDVDLEMSSRPVHFDEDDFHQYHIKTENK